MEQILAMGTDEGLTQAVGQIDAILAGDAVARHPDSARRADGVHRCFRGGSGV